MESWGWALGKTRPILVEFVDQELIKKGKVLDLCCSAGTNTVYLAGKGFEVIAINISQRAVEYAREKAKYANVKINFMTQSFADLSFGGEEFDFVFDMSCFHHVEIVDRSKSIKGVHRVLKKGGDYLLTCFSYRNGHARNHFTEKLLISLFSDCFGIKRNQTFFFHRRQQCQALFLYTLKKKE
jgi:2-polyprenyl-3-methyl-5-hydroxy-6-metoxy-1,4-benzoquinol methylase